MTREEALDELNVIYERLLHPEDCEQGVYSFRDGDYLEALDMAIKTLEQKPCDDTVSREDAKSFLYERLNRLNNDELYDIFSVIIDDMYNELPPVQPVGGWIPVSERLPEDGDTYLVTIEYNGKVIGVDAASYSPVEGYIDKHWDTFNDWKEDEDSCYHVTAWMPLPEPYAPNN